jgi:hypothetical protein
VATEQRHEGLDEAKACRDAAQNLKVNFKLRQNFEKLPDVITNNFFSSCEMKIRITN